MKAMIYIYIYISYDIIMFSLQRRPTQRPHQPPTLNPSHQARGNLFCATRAKGLEDFIPFIFHMFMYLRTYLLEDFTSLPFLGTWAGGSESNSGHFARDCLHPGTLPWALRPLLRNYALGTSPNATNAALIEPECVRRLCMPGARGKLDGRTPRPFSLPHDLCI